jgi:hypothetical protein
VQTGASDNNRKETWCFCWWLAWMSCEEQPQAHVIHQVSELLKKGVCRVRA